MICKHIMVAVNRLIAVNRLASCRVKVVILIHTIDGKYPPSRGDCTIDGVVHLIRYLKQSGHFPLTHAVVIKPIDTGHRFIFITWYDLDAGHRNVIHIVVEVITGSSPSLPDRLIQGKGILESLVCGGEMSAPFARVIRIDIGINIVLLLHRRSVCQIIQCAGAQINIIV